MRIFTYIYFLFICGFDENNIRIHNHSTLQSMSERIKLFGHFLNEDTQGRQSAVLFTYKEINTYIFYTIFNILFFICIYIFIIIIFYSAEKLHQYYTYVNLYMLAYIYVDVVGIIVYLVILSICFVIIYVYVYSCLYMFYFLFIYLFSFLCWCVCL